MIFDFIKRTLIIKKAWNEELRRKRERQERARLELIERQNKDIDLD